MAKFNLNQILNEKSKEEAKNVIKIKNIPLDKIIPDERNFYTVDYVEDLKESILLIGLQQPLVVREQEDGTFKLSTGHRRLKALKELVEEGHQQFETASCNIQTQIDELRAELQLIMTNSTARELTQYEKYQQAKRLRELLTQLKESGIKLPGRMREIVAKTLKTSVAQVGRMENIDNNLTKEFKEEFKNDKINISTANELSGLAEEEQKQAFKEYKNKGTIAIADVKKKKQNIKPKIEPIEEEKQIEEVEPTINKLPEEARPKQVKKILVSSPYGGKEENYLKAVMYCRYVAKQGHIPFASHVMLHGIFSDVGEDRIKGLAAGLQMVSIVDEIWVFTEEVTSGMEEEIKGALKLGIPVIKILGVDNHG